MNAEIFKNYYEQFEHHLGLITVLVGLLPFVVAFIITVIFANGHVTVANYMLQQIGVYQIWTIGLAYILHVILQQFLLIFILENGIAKPNYSWHRLMLNGLVIGIGLIILPLSIFVGMLSGLLIARVFFRSRLLKIARENGRKLIKYVIIYFSVYILFTGLVTFPQVPYTKLTFDDRSTTKVRILSSNDGWYFAVKEKTKELVSIQASGVRKKELCSESDGVLSQTIFEYFGKEKVLPPC